MRNQNSTVQAWAEGSKFANIWNSRLGSARGRLSLNTKTTKIDFLTSFVWLALGKSSKFFIFSAIWQLTFKVWSDFFLWNQSSLKHEFWSSISLTWRCLRAPTFLFSSALLYTFNTSARIKCCIPRNGCLFWSRFPGFSGEIDAF